jgi:four helix bundle protein
MSIRGYADLRVWQRSMELLDGAYDIAGSLPKIELFALAAQMRRAAVSIPANIAEGHGRASRADYARFISIARGSLMELETLLLIALRRGYLNEAGAREVLALSAEISRMLSRLHQRLRETRPANPELRRG